MYIRNIVYVYAVRMQGTIIQLYHSDRNIATHEGSAGNIFTSANTNKGDCTTVRIYVCTYALYSNATVTVEVFE